MLNNILDLNTITLNSALVIGGFTLLCVATLGYTSYSLINYFSAPAPDANNIASEDVGIQAIIQQVDAAIQTTARVGTELKNAELATARLDVGVQTSKRLLERFVTDLYLDGWSTDPSVPWTQEMLDDPTVAEAPNILLEDKSQVENWLSKSLEVPTNTASGTSQLSPLSEPLTPTSKVAAIDKELEYLREIKNSLDVPGDDINLTDPIILHHNKYLEIKALYSKELYEECISNTELLGIINKFDLCDLSEPDFNEMVLGIIKLYNSGVL